VPAAVSPPTHTPAHSQREGCSRHDSCHSVYRCAARRACQLSQSQGELMLIVSMAHAGAQHIRPTARMAGGAPPAQRRSVTSAHPVRGHTPAHTLNTCVVLRLTGGWGLAGDDSQHQSHLVAGMDMTCADSRQAAAAADRRGCARRSRLSQLIQRSLHTTPQHWSEQRHVAASDAPVCWADTRLPGVGQLHGRAAA
jgi:hypothetical protein